MRFALCHHFKNPLNDAIKLTPVIVDLWQILGVSDTHFLVQITGERTGEVSIQSNPLLTVREIVITIFIVQVYKELPY